MSMKIPGVRTPENLLKLYFDSVGRGANLNLNVPPDRRGRIHEEDKKSLAGFRVLLDELYSRNFASGAQAESSSSWKGHGAEQVLDRKRTTYWVAAPEDKHPCVVLKLPEPAAFDVIRLAEPFNWGRGCANSVWRCVRTASGANGRRGPA